MRDLFWQIKIKLLSKINRLKDRFVKLKHSLRHLDFSTIRRWIKSFFAGIIPFFKNTPKSLAFWTTKAKNGRLRLILLFSILSVIFGYAAAQYYFIANDGFIAFRYVANAVDGFGYVFNRPPFAAVSGFTSFLWLICLRLMWFLGIEPPFSADILTFGFSMGTVALGFLFLRRMPMHPNLQSKSLVLFLLLCLILLVNPTFLAFFWSGTDAALFNFLVLWWTYEITARVKRPILISMIAILLILTRWDGILFAPFTLVVLALFARSSKLKSFTAFLILGVIWFYFKWLSSVYGSPILNSFKAYRGPDAYKLGSDYIGSFVVEYGLYFWIVFVFAWAGFKLLRHRTKELAYPFLLIFFFTVYACAYGLIMGADVLSYKPFGFFVPLIAIGALRILTSNITRTIRFIVATVGVYLVIATAIPLAHYRQVNTLTTRKETAFLYKPVPAEKQPFYMFCADYWNKARKRLVYQGAALSIKEHQVLFRELEKSLPTRAEGLHLKPEYRRLFAWDFVGQTGWIFPYAYMIDTSGQNDIFIPQLENKNKYRRLLGHEKNIPAGYVACFNGGSNLLITPFNGKPDVKFSATGVLTDGIIKGCEGFWRDQIEMSYKRKKPVLKPL